MLSEKLLKQNLLYDSIFMKHPGLAIYKYKSRLVDT